VTFITTYPMLPLSANAPAFRRDVHASRSSRGFTLIELLTVIAIIAILASITISVIGGVNYKRQYGDYPQTDKSDELLQALVGRRGPRGADIKGKILLELSKFTTKNTLDPLKTDAAVLIDAWDRPYDYVYKPGSAANSWTNPGYVLYSRGPKDQGKVSVDGKGLATTNDGKYGTYIFANKL
jgi:prepilin-type N-terminal cleavage/methylation domain-containing protein